MYAGRRKKLFVLMLTAAIAVSLIDGYFSETVAMGTKTVAVTGKNFKVFTSMGVVANVTLDNNTLYGYNHLSNPSVMFRNITKQISFAAYYSYYSSSSTTVRVSFIFRQTLYSASTPSYSKLMNYSSTSFSHTGSNESRWVTIPVNITDVLSSSEQINTELNVEPGPPSLNVNVTAITDVGRNVTSSFSDVNLSFSYTLSSVMYHNQLENYTYITDSGQHSNKSVIAVNDDAVINLPNNKTLLGWVSDISFMTTFLALTMLVAMFIPVRRDKLGKFISDNKDEIVRVKSRPSIRRWDFSVNSPEELLRTSIASNKPLLMYEGDNLTILYVRTEEAGYYMSFRRKHAK